MGIGLGGGIGPFRAGISTRGFGVGVGPLSARSGWGRRRRSSSSDDVGAGCAFVVVLSFVFLAVAWPYYLGTWLALQAGSTEGSTASKVTGWTLEGAYLLVLLLLFGAVATARAKRSRLDAMEADIDRLRTELQAAEGIAETCSAIIRRIVAAPLGSPSKELAGANLLFRLLGVALVEPRVAERNGPRVPTEVDTGDLMATSKALKFYSARKSVEWRVDRILKEHVGGDYVTWNVSNRKTVSGIGGSESIRVIVRGLRIWASELPESPTEAEMYFRRELETANTAAQDLRKQIQSKCAHLSALRGGTTSLPANGDTEAGNLSSGSATDH